MAKLQHAHLRAPVRHPGDTQTGTVVNLNRKMFKPHSSHGKKFQFAHEDGLSHCGPKEDKKIS
jgi:hypothetical protein